MKNLFIIAMLLSCSLTGAAQTFFNIDGIRYMIEDDHAVIARQDNGLTGELVIPAKVTYGDDEYNVTRMMNPDECGDVGTFQECGITSISLPVSISEIPAFSFYRCNSLSSVTIPKSVTSIGYQTFGECSSLTSINVSEDNLYYSSENGVLFNKNKSTLLRYPQSKTETTYIIPNSVKTIDDCAFDECNNLASVTIPSSVTSLGSSVFEHCSGLTTISIGRNVTGIPWHGFRDCPNLSEVWCYATTVPTVDPDAFEESNYTNATLYVRSSLLEDFRNAEIWNSFKEYNEITSLQEYAPYHTIFVADGIRYMTEDNDVVIARQDRELSGDIIIPSTVTYEGKDYNVIRLISPYESESGGGGAFQECAITGISLPTSITEIPDITFYDCKQLCSVTLNGPVTRIGHYSFQHCEALSTIDLPDDVTEIGQFAFQGSGLTEFKVPTGVTWLSTCVCADTKLTYIEIPATVTYIQSGCFACWETEPLPVKKTVKMFQRDCRLIDVNEGSPFGNMTQLVNIDLLVPAGGKVVYQEYYPWSNMHCITEFGEDTGETLMPDQRYVTIDGIRYLLKDGEASVDIQPETLSGEVTIPDKVTYEDTDYPVTTVVDAYHIADGGAFSYTKVTKVTLPSSIKKIGWQAFKNAQNLQEVVLNEGVTEIVEGAFEGCQELTTINIPSTLTVINGGLFKECHKLKNITLNEGLKELQEGVFYNSGIETLTIPSTCTTLGSGSLYLPNLKTLIMKVKEPTDIVCTGSYHLETMNCAVFADYFLPNYEEVRAFLSNIDIIVPLGCANSYNALRPWIYCHSITEEGEDYYQPKTSVVNIDGINYMLHETINDQDETVRTATVACQNINLSGDIVIPEKVTYAQKDYDVTDIFTSIIELNGDDRGYSSGEGAFQDCGITSVSLPATITTIPTKAFYGCQQLKSVTLPEGITTIRAGAFANCSSLEEIYLPETINYMEGRYIFRNCTNLKKVNIPKQVTSLSNECFQNSGIETFIIPQNITSIGEACFADTHLKNIKICHESYSDGSMSFPENMFYDNISGITLIVPEGTRESLYTQVYPWKDFENIIEYKDQEDEHLYNAYNVSYEEEVIGHEQEASDDTTILDYVPSGVDTELPEDTEKEDYVLIGWHDKQGHTPHTVMPAQDILLRLTLALLGDANRDGDVDVSDFLSVANYILGRNPVGFLHKAANTSKGDNEIDVADFLGVANVILRGVHYRNPHHAPARRTASNTDISTMDNAIYVEPASLCVGLEQTLSVKMKNVNPVAGFEFCLQLPEGITVTGASLSNERTTSAKTSSFSHAVLDDGTVKVLCGTMTQNPETGKLYTFDGNDGEVATITISIDPNMTLGNYSAIVTNAKLADADAVKTTISSNVESVITVSDVLVLDENSTMMPPTANGVTVTVRRTIKANEWSTICLPFDMTEEQVKAAFGTDVQLAEFSSYDAVKDGDNVTSITINFEDADLSEGFYGNYPYIIKTSSDITEFTLTANVVPDDAVAEYTNGKTGSKKVVYGSYIGTYKAKTVVPENCLFLSSNKFWYSAGLTKMKAFRAYFDFLDILSEVENANARITMSLDNQTEGIKENLGITPQPIKLYDLQGRLVKKPGKGLYIQNGRKVIK